MIYWRKNKQLPKNTIIKKKDKNFKKFKFLKILFHRIKKKFINLSNLRYIFIKSQKNYKKKISKKKLFKASYEIYLQKLKKQQTKNKIFGEKFWKIYLLLKLFFF